jgi:hypothetical protein
MRRRKFGERKVRNENDNRDYLEWNFAGIK